MKKEIKVRRKRFFAFLLALVLVCSSVVPTRIEAEDYSNAAGSISKGDILQAGDVITPDAKSEICTIAYYDYNGNELGRYEIRFDSDMNSHLVQEYKAEGLNGNVFVGWEVKTVSTSGGYINLIELWAVRNDVRYEEGILYIDAIYLEDTSTGVDLGNYPTGSENMDAFRRVYSTGALQGFTGTLTYEGNTYANPGVELIVDSNSDVYSYGVYNVDGAELTIYAAPSYGYITDKEIGTASYEINGYYYMDADGTKYYDKVTFASGAIKNTDIDGNIVTSIRVSGNEASSSSSNGVGEYVICADSMDVYNYSSVPVTVHGNAQLWVSWSEGYGNTEEGVINKTYESTDTVKIDENSGYTFAKSGETITITPKPDYSLYGIKLENNVADQADYMAWQEKYIEHCTDGIKIVTIPNISASLFVNAGQVKCLFTENCNPGLEELPDYSEYAVFERKSLNIEGEDWYGEAFTVSAVTGDWFADPEYVGLIKPIYQICELTRATDEGQFKSEVVVSREGKDIVINYILIDMSLRGEDLDGDGNPDRIYNGEHYGEIMILSDRCNMDLNSPVIDADTGVTMADANGTQIPLLGSWQSVENTDITKINWTNQLPLTIAVNADAGLGIPVGGYQIHAVGEESNNFQPENTRTFDKEGYYELYISAQDKYDEASGRALKSHWVAALGIDTTKPAIGYTDDKNSDANIELISNQEYEGTLYLFAEDSSADIAEVTVYESQDGVWTENNNILISADDTGKNYSILPLLEDKVYRIVVSDKAGNENVYENITVKAAPTTEEDVPIIPEPEKPGTETPEPEKPGTGADGSVGMLIQGSGLVELEPGIVYELEEGTWKVEGDSTSYVGGITFYVSEAGTYNFIKE